jgi:hypothetical protein
MEHIDIEPFFPDVEEPEAEVEEPETDGVYIEPMKNLEMEEAVAVTGMISTSTDEEFKKKITEAMKTCAGARKGLYAMASAWYGTPLPQDARTLLEDEFGIEYLYRRNLLSCDGEYIELLVLGSAMPDEFLNNFFEFDIAERAAEHGVTVSEIEDFVRDTYRGIDEDGDYLFEFDEEDKRYVYLMVLGVGGFGSTPDGKYHKVYTDMCPFGIQNIRNILFRNTQGESNDAAKTTTPEA